MTVLQAEVKWYKSAVISDAGSNGGRMSITQAVSAVNQNLFPNVSQAERTAGVTRYRKQFAKVASAGDETLANAYAFMARYAPGDDIVQFFAGTQTDTQSGISSPTLYGNGKLHTTVSGGATSIVVDVEDWSQGAIFRNGDTIRVSDKASIGDSGNSEIVTISGAPGVSGNQITLSITPALANGYNSASTYVSSGLSLGNIVGTFDNWVETSGSGTYAEGTVGNVVVDSIGGIEQTWTITFTSATAFTLTGDTLGAVGSGSRSSNFAPNNPDFSQPYFTILSGGWGGTWATGNTIVFQTHPAAKGIWFKQIVPAGAAALSSDFIRMVISGESA